MFATQQLKEHHEIIDNAPSSVSHNTTPMNDQDEHSATPSTDGHYMTLQRATTENPENQNTRPKVRDQWPYKQRPDVLIGEVFFNFHTHQYNLMHSGETISPFTIIYHAEQDKCFYLSTHQQWEAIPLESVPNEAQCVLWQMGPLHQPDVMPMGRSIITPPPISSQVQPP